MNVQFDTRVLSDTKIVDGKMESNGTPYFMTLELFQNDYKGEGLISYSLEFSSLNQHALIHDTALVDTQQDMKNSFIYKLGTLRKAAQYAKKHTLRGGHYNKVYLIANELENSTATVQVHHRGTHYTMKISSCRDSISIHAGSKERYLAILEKFLNNINDFIKAVEVTNTTCSLK